MLSYDSCNSIEHMLNMIYQNQNKINNLKNNLSNLNSNNNFIQCEIPKFLNELGIGYRFYFANYTVEFTDTVIYAI